MYTLTDILYFFIIILYLELLKLQGATGRNSFVVYITQKARCLVFKSVFKDYIKQFTKNWDDVAKFKAFPINYFMCKMGI